MCQSLSAPTVLVVVCTDAMVRAAPFSSLANAKAFVRQYLPDSALPALERALAPYCRAAPSTQLEVMGFAPSDQTGAPPVDDQETESADNAAVSKGDGNGARDSHEQLGSAFELLSKREAQVVRMIGMGKAVGMIAQELGLSVKTVSTYRTRALEKMSMKTNADLIRYVIQSEQSLLR